MIEDIETLYLLRKLRVTEIGLINITWYVSTQMYITTGIRILRNLAFLLFGFRWFFYSDQM